MNNSEYITPSYEQTPLHQSGEVVSSRPSINIEAARAFGEATINAKSIYDPNEAIPGLEPRIRPLTPEQIHLAKVSEISDISAKIFDIRRNELDWAI